MYCFTCGQPRKKTDRHVTGEKEKSGKNIVVVSPSAVPADRLEEAAHAVAAALYKAEEAAKAK